MEEIKEEKKPTEFECPVCHKHIGSEFALQGHIRLMQDDAHIAFRQVNKKKEEKMIKPASLTTPFEGIKLRDRLTDLIKNQEEQYIAQAEDDAVLSKLKALEEQERTNDIIFHRECFREGYDCGTKDYEKNKIPALLKQKEIEFIEKEKKIRTECAVEKECELNEMKLKYEEKIYDINREFDKERRVLILKYGISVPCRCNSDKFVEKNSQLHFEIIQLMLREGLGHPECMRIYDPEKAYLWDCAYINYLNFLAYTSRRYN